ncbi:MAG: phage tail protein, partial [Propionibacteriaceae bacterium]|nr:phage tail protein [Propionibacteriaceae bacterium]
MPVEVVVMGSLVVTVLDRAGRPAGFVSRLVDATLLHEVAGEHVLAFTAAVADARGIGADTLVGCENTVWRCVKPVVTHDGTQPMVTVTAYALWYDLGRGRLIREREWADTDAASAIGTVLDGSGWTTGMVAVGGRQTYTTETGKRLAVLRQIAAAHGGDLVFDTHGRTVSLLGPEGPDTGVFFAFGKNLVSLKRTEDSSRLATRVYATRADGQTFADVNGGLDYVEDLSWTTEVVPDELTFPTSTPLVQMLAETRVYTAAAARPVVTYEIDVADLSDAAGHPFDALRVRDMVTVYDPAAGVEAAHKVVALSVPLLNRETTRVTLDSAPLRLDQVLSSLSGTSAASGQGKVPGTPTRVEASSWVSFDLTGRPAGAVGLVWDKVDTPAGTDPAGLSYEVWGHQDGSSRLPMLVKTSEPAAIVTPLPPGETWVFRVRAAASDGTVSAMSAPATITVAADREAPPVPSLPAVSVQAGAVTLTWDGLSASGQLMPVDTAEIRVWLDGTAEPVTRFGRTADLAVFTSLPHRQPARFRLDAADTSGNASAATDWVTVTPVGAADPDQVAGLIADGLADTTAALGGLDSRLAGAETTLGQAVGDLARTRTAVDTLAGTTIPALADSLAAAGTAVDGIGGQVTAVQQDLQAARNQITQLETDVGEAQAAASEGITQAVQAATAAAAGQAEAEKARLAAAAAQTTAESKTRTFTTQPVPPYQVADLWVQAGKVSVCVAARASGSYTAADWVVQATDDQAAAAANTTADQALTSAGGKSTNLYLSAVPTTATAGKPGDTCWVVGADGVATAQYRCTQGTGVASGNTWTEVDYGAGVIADSAVTASKLTAAAVTAAKLATDAVTSDAILAGAVGTAELAALAVTTAKIANLAVGSAQIGDAAVVEAKIGTAAVVTAAIKDAAITTAKIANLAVTNAQIADATIQSAKIVSLDAGKITTGTLDAARIAAGSVTSDKLTIADGFLTNAMIATATITGAKIAAATIATGNIANLAVTSALIADAAVGTAKIADAAVTTAKIGSAQITAALIGQAAVDTAAIKDLAVTTAKIANLAVTNAQIGNVDAGKITTGYLDANRIAAKTITADKVLVGGTNMFPDPWLAGGTATYTSATTIATGGGYTGGNTVTIAAGTAQRGAYASAGCNMPATPGQTYWVSAWVKPAADAPAKTLSVYLGRRLHSSTSNVTTTQVTNPAAVAKDTWVQVKGQVTTTAATTWDTLTLGCYLEAAYTGSAVFSDLIVTAATSGELLVDGAVTATKITTGAVTTDHLSAGAVTAAKIAAATITAAELAAGAVTTAQLAAGAVTAGKITAGTITAAELAAQTITGDKIAARSVTTDKLVIGSTSNMLPDPVFTTTGWTSTWTRDTATIRSAGYASLKFPAATTQRLTWYGTASSNTAAPRGKAGATYQVLVYARSDTDIPAKGVSVKLSASNAGGSASTDQGSVQNTAVITKDTWSLVQGTFTVTTAQGESPYLLFGLAAETTATGAVWFTEPVLRQMAAGELIVDGAITTAKIAASAITADKITAGAIDATKLTATAVDGKTITGATIQTVATANRGVKLDTTGLTVYDTAGNKTMTVDANGIVTITTVTTAQLTADAVAAATVGAGRTNLCPFPASTAYVGVLATFTAASWGG